jgi:hypothetical protein
MDLKSILNSPPKVHDWGSGELTASGLPLPFFEFMNLTLTKESVSLETGMRISTAVFAINSGNHTCITPDPNEIDQFKEYSVEHNFPIDNIRFVKEKSCEVWSNLKNNSSDFILIDGGHGFPTPFMDWYFFSQGLKINGCIIIDDTHISTCRTLKDFLLKEDAWKMIPPFSEKTVVFQKIKDFDYNKEFSQQAYVVEQTLDLNRYKKLKNLPARIKWKLESTLKGIFSK